MTGFAAVLGQPNALAELRREMARGRLAHAYLFEGAPGTGRHTLARGLAAEVLCRDGRACGACSACRLLASGNHPDFLELPRDAAPLALGRFVERSGSDAGVRSGADLPPVLSFLHLRPAAGERRVVIIPDAERMQAPAANALLKTLEEPPAAGLLLLTTSARERLPVTVVSRCRRVGVHPLPPAEVAAELVRRGAAAEGDGAREAAELSEGSLGLALMLAEGAAAADWRWLQTALPARGAAGAEALARGWIERAREGAGGKDAAARRARAARLLDLSALWLRRRLRDGAEPLAASAALEVLWTAADRLAHNVRVELVLTAAATDWVVLMAGEHGRRSCTHRPSS